MASKDLLSPEPVGRRPTGKTNRDNEFEDLASVVTQILLLLIAVLLVAVVVVVVYFQRRSARTRTTTSAATAPRPTGPRDPFADVGETSGDPLSLKAGDMLDFGVERTWIRGTLRLSEGGADWAEHFLEVEGARRWLSVEQDPDVQMAMWTGRPELDLTPHSDVIEFEGARYRLVERGTASYRSEGTTGLRPHGGMDYADYEGPDGRHLSFERFDHGRWEPSTGTTTAAGDFTIFPAG